MPDILIRLIVFLLIKQSSGKRSEAILKSNDEYRLHPELEPLVTSIILRTKNLNCLAIVCDETYQDVFGGHFYDRIRDVTFFKILVPETEDLMSPNYDTLSTIRRIRENSCQAYVVLLSNGNQVGRFLRFGDKYRDIDARANFILLHDDRLLQPQLHYLWKRIVNVLFIRKFTANQGSSTWYELSTVPFPAPIMDVLIPRRLDTWRHGYFYLNAELFRDKTSNLRSQIFRVITFQHVPAAFKMPAPSISPDVTLEGTEPVGYTGLEIEVLDTLSSVMNFEPEVYDVSTDEKWGWKQFNGSFSGLLGEMVSGRADIALGDLHYTPYHLELLDLTIPYNTQCLTFLTPESLTDNSWQTLILPFRGYMWAGVLVGLVSGGVVFLALAKFHRVIESQIATTDLIAVKNKEDRFRLNPGNKLSNQVRNEELVGLYQFEQPVNCFLYTYGMLLLVSLPKLPAGWSLRIFTGWWWIYCILVVVAYRASMTSILANPVPRVTIDTLEQLAESQISVGGWGEEIKRFFQTSLDAAGKRVGSKFEVVYDVDEAIERVAAGEFAFYENIYYLKHASVHRQLISMEEKRAYGNPNNVTTSVVDRNLHIMRDCVINMPISLGLQKNSPLKPRVDKFLQLIIEAGLVKKWLNDAMAQVLIADSSGEGQPIKALMDLKKLYGAFITLAIGYGLGSLLLIGEIAYWRLIVKRHPLYDIYLKTVLK